MSAEPKLGAVPAPEPSIAGLSPKPFPGAPPGFVIRAALALRRLFLDLADAVVPAEVSVFEAATGAASTQLLGAAARHRVADLLQGGPLTATAIAAKTGTRADVVHRTLRALATRGIFTLDRHGRFANNRRSRTLLADRLTRTRDFAEYFASRSNCDAWTDYEAILRTGTNGFERVHGMSVWDWFDAHPEEREGFAQAMMGMTFRDAPVVASVYPFAESRRVCDVGGGRGTLLSEILIRHPHLQGVLCDNAGVLESARPLLERREVAARVELAAGNFFESVPRGADTYMMKTILHDWDDARAKKILAACRRAMEPGHKLLIVEFLQETNRTGFGALADVQMMVVCGDGRERGREEYRALFAATGFAPGRIFERPTASVIEAVAK